MEQHILMTIMSLIGCGVRLTYEWEKTGKLKPAKILLVIFGSLALSYIIITFSLFKKYMPVEMVGITSIISGILSLEVVTFFINYLPNILRLLINKKFTINLEEQKDTK